MSQFPNIYFVCVHKGASTFIASNLFPSLATQTGNHTLYYVGREYVEWFHENSRRLKLDPTAEKTEYTRRLGMMLEERPMPKSGGLIARLYPNQIEAICEHTKDSFPPENSKVFVMRRDPRDALVSMYYSKAFSHCAKGMLTVVKEDTLNARRNKMRDMGVYQWIKKTLENPKNMEVVEEFRSCADILQGHPQVVDLPYELLITNPKQWLQSFVKASELEDHVDKAWYREMRKQLVPPKKVDQNQHKRRVTPGNWREVFDDNLRDLMNDRIGPKMEQMQYLWD